MTHRQAARVLLSYSFTVGVYKLVHRTTEIAFFDSANQSTQGQSVQTALSAGCQLIQKKKKGQTH